MTVKEKQKLWLKEKKMPSYLLDELKNMTKDEINEAFYKDLEFGTGGLRGIMGAGTNRMNIYTVRKTTLGFANYLINKFGDNALKKGVVIGFDNRHHSKDFAKEASEVLANLGFKVYLFKELRPTPLTSFAVRYYNAIGGIMITASHNPKIYNGYKVYNKTGAQLDLEEADEVINEINKLTNYFNIKTKSDKNLIIPILEEVEKAYLDEVRKIQINKTKKSGILVYSATHGTGQTIIPKFIKDEGYSIINYTPHSTIDPNFTNARVTNPELPEAWFDIKKFAKDNNADLIIMTDPDADRVGLACRHNDNYILLNGNQSGAIACYYLLNEKKKNKKLSKKGYVCSTIVSTDLVGEIAKSFGLKSYQTLTGFKNIAKLINDLEGKETYEFGFEESIGFIVSDFVRDKDAVQSTLNFLEIASYLKDQNKTLIDYLEEIHSKYGYYLEYTYNLVLEGLEGAKKIQKIMDHFRTNGLEIPGLEFLKKEDYKTGILTDKKGKQSKLSLPKSNVLKYFYKDSIWVVLRPSGTEPKLKIYFSVKAKSKNEVEEKVNKITKQVLDQVFKIEG